MTHDELLAKIDAKLDKCTCDGWNNNCFDDDNVPWLILRAVVELHKPYLTKDNRQFCSNHCERSIDDSYPCPTIQAIQEQLK